MGSLLWQICNKAVKGRGPAKIPLDRYFELLSQKAAKAKSSAIISPPILFAIFILFHLRTQYHLYICQLLHCATSVVGNLSKDDFHKHVISFKDCSNYTRALVIRIIVSIVVSLVI